MRHRSQPAIQQFQRLGWLSVGQADLQAGMLVVSAATARGMSEPITDEKLATR